MYICFANTSDCKVIDRNRIMTANPSYYVADIVPETLVTNIFSMIYESNFNLKIYALNRILLQWSALSITTWHGGCAVVSWTKIDVI